MNWIIMIRKSGKHLRTTYGNSEQLFRPNEVSSAVYTVISPTRDRTSDHRFQNQNFTIPFDISNLQWLMCYKTKPN